jgi:hypothetical protein
MQRQRTILFVFKRVFQEYVMVIPTDSLWSQLHGGGGGLNKAEMYFVRFALQRHCTENWKQKFPEKKLRGLVTNSYIHVSVSDLYILTSRIGRPIVGIYESLIGT